MNNDSLTNAIAKTLATIFIVGILFVFTQIMSCAVGYGAAMGWRIGSGEDAVKVIEGK